VADENGRRALSPAGHLFRLGLIELERKYPPAGEGERAAEGTNRKEARGGR
jgi:hypothetical protein